VKGSLTRKLGFPVEPSVKSIDDPVFIAWKASPAARALACCSHSIRTAMLADTRPEAVGDDEDELVEDATPTECLAAAAVFAICAAVCASEACPETTLDPVALLRHLTAVPPRSSPS
jgi:hypothetical protein